MSFSEGSLSVRLDGGRALGVPLAWHPRLLDATAAERADYELIGDGEALLAGRRRPAKSAGPLKKWRQQRR